MLKAVKDIPRKSRLQQLIRQEREFLQETTAEFVNAAKRFIGSLLSWVLWRVLIPMVLLSAVLMVFR